LAPIQVSPLLPAIPGYIFFSVSLFLLIVYFNKQECPKKSGYLKDLHPLKQSSESNFHISTMGIGENIFSSNKLDERLLRNQRELTLLPFKICKKYEKKVLQNNTLYWDDFEEYLKIFARKNPSKRLFLESKIALNSGFNDSTDIVEIGRTSYFTSIITNEACTSQMLRNSRILSDFRTIYPYNLESKNGQQTGNLLPLEQSELSNHLGISTLALTKDRYLIIHRQNQLAMHSSGYLVPSGSGSLDWKDKSASGSKDFLDVVKYGMVRELCEEISSEKAASTTYLRSLSKKTLIIGYFRWVSRAGHPEYIGISQIDVNVSSVQSNSDEVESTSNSELKVKPWTNSVGSCSELIDICSKTLALDNVSVPLAAILTQLEKILRGSLGDEAKKQVIDLWGLKN
ncbi:hypothetical protein ACO0LC_23175, partial [Undibacterium sp. JH2W]|uniref:hypothetical protein n=1 Tax=Undibacterium sp. JH2W TaxID=3413037 RepID=UPI003BF3EEDC